MIKQAEIQQIDSCSGWKGCHSGIPISPNSYRDEESQSGVDFNFYTFLHFSQSLETFCEISENWCSNFSKNTREYLVDMGDLTTKNTGWYHFSNQRLSYSSFSHILFICLEAHPD